MGTAGVMWTFEEALTLIQEISFLLGGNGWGIGLTGGVLLNGESKRDLDLIAFPLDKRKVDHDQLHQLLEHAFGWVLKWDANAVHELWKRKHRHDTKHVEVWMVKDKRVDLFILT